MGNDPTSGYDLGKQVKKVEKHWPITIFIVSHDMHFCAFLLATIRILCHFSAKLWLLFQLHIIMYVSYEYYSLILTERVKHVINFSASFRNKANQPTPFLVEL